MTDSDPSHYFGTSAGVDIEVHVEGSDADSPPGPSITTGTSTTLAYMISNTGNVTLSSVSVTSSLPYVSIACPGSSLTAWQTMTCDVVVFVEAGQQVNTGTVTASSPVGSVTDSDPCHFFGDSAPVEWEWTCEWYISQYELGVISYEDIPAWCLPLPPCAQWAQW